MFGGLWQPSPLGYAVEQFFDNGGREALIVRVVNGARSATLTLKAGARRCTCGRCVPVPGNICAPASTTTISRRTSARIQSDGAARARPGHRPGGRSGNIPPSLSLLPAAEGYLPRAIADRSWFGWRRDAGAAARPDLGCGERLATAYVKSNSDGDDGAPLTDYDLIGSEIERTGLLRADRRGLFQLLCIPPLVARSGRGTERSVGGCALLQGAPRVADRRSARRTGIRRTMPCAGMRDWNFSSENALMYFPRDAGARQAARPFRVLCTLRRRRRHVGAQR